MRTPLVSDSTVVQESFSRKYKRPLLPLKRSQRTCYIQVQLVYAAASLHGDCLESLKNVVIQQTT